MFKIFDGYLVRRIKRKFNFFIAFPVIKSGAYWRAAFKRVGRLFLIKRNYSHNIFPFQKAINNYHFDIQSYIFHS